MCIISNSGCGGSSSNLVSSSVKIRNDKRSSSGASEKKRLSWADELIFGQNDDENSPRPPLCQTFELYEQFHTTDSRSSSEDKSTTTTDLAPIVSAVDNRDNDDEDRRVEEIEKQIKDTQSNSDKSSFNQQNGLGDLKIQIKIFSNA